MKKLLLGLILLLAFNTSVKASDYVLKNNSQISINILEKMLQVDNLITKYDNDGCSKWVETITEKCYIAYIRYKLNPFSGNCERYEERFFLGAPGCTSVQTPPKNPQCDYDSNGNIIGCSVSSPGDNPAYPGECWLDENDVQHCD